MGARLIPAEPAFAHPTEREVWDLLVSQLDEDCILLSNVHLTDHEQDHEADLVVLLPDAGVVVVEVKGGSVSVDHEGRWHQSGGGSSRPIDPVGQAQRVKHALRQYVQDDPRWRDSSRSRVRWLHTVVTPYSAVPEGFSQPACPREMVHGRDDLGRLATRLRTLAETHETNYRRPDHGDVELIAEILTGRNLMSATTSWPSPTTARRAPNA
ncbi:nuclease-related domain-containing protein [Ornithinimicrobium sp. W1665]|uniref:nuclease-related domain-containing protein n=1 Tax=Ornithinimicrobium sp. W1665 TaxID=3416666 RepID=UPI003D6C1C34